jgi:hypothetical protein
MEAQSISPPSAGTTRSSREPYRPRGKTASPGHAPFRTGSFNSTIRVAFPSASVHCEIPTAKSTTRRRGKAPSRALKKARKKYAAAEFHRDRNNLSGNLDFEASVSPRIGLIASGSQPDSRCRGGHGFSRTVTASKWSSYLLGKLTARRTSLARSSCRELLRRWTNYYLISRFRAMRLLSSVFTRLPQAHRLPVSGLTRS